ncbi:MAG: phosphoribosyltransferase family protein [Actinomycetota bacterium]|nr:phosphoribosyltransferase family protein [Actinomycetota bacterium]
MQFQNRRAAGKELGRAVAELAPIDPVVLALPRGGMPVGFEVAAALGCELDVLVVRKVGVPSQRELAMGAVAEHDVVIRNEEVLALAGVSEEAFLAGVERERLELARRLEMYRGTAEAVKVVGRTAVIVDDGLATGSTAEAGIEALRHLGAGAVWVAVPVAPRDTSLRLGRIVDRLVVLSQPRYFQAVGAWYGDFRQTSDEEVETLLAESRLR